METAALPAQRDGTASELLYERVSTAIREWLVQHGTVAGARLPSERELCARFAVSRVTVRKALTHLAGQGLIVPLHGLGWLVAGAVATDHLEEHRDLVSFSAMGAARGLVASSRVLVARLSPAALDQAEALRIAPGEAVVELRRVRLLNETPIAVQTSLVPEAVAPGLLEVDFNTASLFETLARRYGRVASRADYLLEAGPADDELAGLLDLAPGQPVLYASETTFDQTGRPIELCRMAYRGDRFRFRTSLRVRPTGRGPL